MGDSMGAIGDSMPFPPIPLVFRDKSHFSSAIPSPLCASFPHTCDVAGYVPNLGVSSPSKCVVLPTQFHKMVKLEISFEGTNAPFVGE